MNAIRLRIKGVLNSFRVPFFRTYHKTFLAPPKTTVIGMLCNIALKSQNEFFEILNNDKIRVSVIIDKIEGRTKDLWSYKIIEKKNRGKSVVRRDKLYNASYTIYLYIEDNNLYKNILKALQTPQNIPSLGLDDELVEIYEVKEVLLEINDTNRIDSIFLDKGLKYRAFVKDLSQAIELPTSNLIPVKFKAFDKKKRQIPKEVLEEYRQVEYINCEIEFEKEVESFIDSELKHKMVFY